MEGHHSSHFFLIKEILRVFNVWGPSVVRHLLIKLNLFYSLESFSLERKHLTKSKILLIRKRFFAYFFKVHDSSAKIPSGLLSGNINQLGDFDQCLSVRSPNNEFSGKYCLAYVQISVPDYLPKMKKIRKLLQAHDAFVNDFDDVSVFTISFAIGLNPIMVKTKMIIFSEKKLFTRKYAKTQSIVLLSPSDPFLLYGSQGFDSIEWCLI